MWTRVELRVALRAPGQEHRAGGLCGPWHSPIPVHPQRQLFSLSEAPTRRPFLAQLLAGLAHPSTSGAWRGLFRPSCRRPSRNLGSPRFGQSACGFGPPGHLPSPLPRQPPTPRTLAGTPPAASPPPAGALRAGLPPQPLLLVSVLQGELSGDPRAPRPQGLPRTEGKPPRLPSGSPPSLSCRRGAVGTWNGLSPSDRKN